MISTLKLAVFLQILVANQSATFVRLIAGQAAKFNVTGNDTVKDRRLHKKLSELGSAALSEADLTELNKIVNWMTNVYSTATVCFDETIPQLKDCPKDKLVHLEPSNFDIGKLKTGLNCCNFRCHKVYARGPESDEAKVPLEKLERCHWLENASKFHPIRGAEK